VATATAFAVTQRLKLEPSPISQTRVSDVFSPVCRCASKAASIEFSLRRADDVRIAVRTGSGEVTVAEGSFAQGDVHVRWDGRDASGELVPDGTYYPFVELKRAGRTIDLPNPIRVDTIRPSIKFTSLRPRVFRPGAEKLKVTYRVSEHAHALLFVDGRRRVFTASTRLRGRLQWYGKVRGHLIRPGRHKVKLVAEDLAGNRSAPTPWVVVRVRRP
jgi:FlgD Ig-like domain